MKTLYVNPLWHVAVAGVHGVLYANMEARLMGLHFDEIVLCMPEIQPLLRHDYTFDDVLTRYRTRLNAGGRIVLDYSDPEAFYYRRAAR